MISVGGKFLEEKGFYMEQRVVCVRECTQGGLIRCLYEMRKCKGAGIIEIPTGCTEIRCMSDGVNSQMEIMEGLTKAEECSFSRYDRCVGIRLTPGVSVRKEALEKDLGLKQQLMKQMLSEISLKDRLREIELLLQAGLLADCPEPVRELVQMLQQNNGCVNVSTCLREMAYSQRRMESLFKEALKLSMKKYAMIVKLQICLGRMEKQIPEVWNDLQFYDQTHFIKSFKIFLSVTPTQYEKNRTEMGVY